MINIPVDAYLITLLVEEQRIVSRQIQVGRTTQIRRERVTEQREHPPGETEASVRTGITQANRILAPTNIAFYISSIAAHRISAPQNRDVVTEDGFLFLARQYQAGSNVRLFVVRSFAGQEGGQAIAAQRVCIVKHLGDPLFGKTLAHELGHLLALEHVTRGVSARYNLMWPALRADDRLEASQIQTARSSALAQQFSGQQSS